MKPECDYELCQGPPPQTPLSASLQLSVLVFFFYTHTHTMQTCYYSWDGANLMSVNITDGESTHFPLTGVYPVYIYIFLIHDLRASPRLTVFFFLSFFESDLQLNSVFVLKVL